MNYLKVYMDIQESNLDNLELINIRVLEIIKELIEDILPLANPDFTKRIFEVKFWYLEFEDESDPPSREIGFINDQPIMVMPFRGNCGYWVDNNMNLEDFKSTFKTEKISEVEFNQIWDNWVYEYRLKKTKKKSLLSLFLRFLGLID